LLQNTKKILPEPMRLLGIILVIGILHSACNTRIEGCLESNAENFDLNAELPCDGCCTYPSMGLILSQKWGPDNFTNADTLYDISGEAYKIEDLRYFLTTWSWTNTAGELFTVDSIENDCHGVLLRYTPDNVIIDTRRFAYTMGAIRENPVTDSVFFSLGLTHDFSCLDDEDLTVPPELTMNSPLWNPATASLETMRLIIRKDSAFTNFDTLFMSLSSNMGLGYVLEIKKGFDTQFELTIDYSLLFADVNIQDPNSFEMSVIAHFRESIFPTP
jgi:hypothetical protein